MAAAHRVLPGFADSRARAALAAVAAEDGWAPGRQGTGYDKLALDEGRLGSAARRLLGRCLAELGDPPDGWWDCYLLRYGAGAFVPEHVDPAREAGLVHVRLNLLVTAAEAGGALRIAGEEVPLAPGDAVVFRPDRDHHALSEVRAGERLAWSVGCNLPERRFARPKRAHGRRRKGSCCR